ncbi:DEAD/DEAH box helicase family protein [Luteococcus sp. Sow4_B9]|uniref:DEAD/DEAH box helicase family protein n=1 Tax=Luteococcus sp. Sow4_B9 TaxID=3438792 RepID=UPI003F946061
MSGLDINFDQADIDAISSDFDLRGPNKKALRALVMALTEDDFDPSVTQVMNLATGAGKTYLMAAFIEYLRRQDVENVMIVTPSLTVQNKTVQNFTHGTRRYIAGAPVPPEVTTPQDYSAWRARQNGPAELQYGHDRPMMTFIFNIQQLIAPKSLEGATHGGTNVAAQLRTRRFDESSGALFEYLQTRRDLVVIADESHLYGPSAQAFSAALRELDPAATIGLTASASPEDHVVFKYPLYQAIADQFVKTPVLAFRKSGYGSDQASEEQQLRDALTLRSLKQTHYDAWTQVHSLPHLNAVAFIVCADVAHATQVAELLRSPGYLGQDSAVLQVDNTHNDAGTQLQLDRLDEADSNVLAVVSVNKLKEGFDVKNIAVIVTLRAMASEVLTQQTMGRGLRLPFGKYTGVAQIDQLDIVSHRSFEELLKAENVLDQFGLAEDAPASAVAAMASQIRNAEQVQTGGVSGAEHADVVEPMWAHETQSPQPGGVFAAVTVDSAETGAPMAVTLIDDDADLATILPPNPEPVVVSMNPQFAGKTFTFPVTTMVTQVPPFSLALITPQALREAAQRVTSSGELMVRKEIVAGVRRKLRVVDAEGAEVESMPVSAEDAQTTLLKLLADSQVIPTTAENIRLAKAHILPNFIPAVTFEQWTVKSVTSAVHELDSLIRREVSKLLAQTHVVTEIHPQTLPIESEFYLPLGEYIHDQIDNRQEFVRGRYYNGWFKSLFDAESFDSWSAEYQLAKLLTISPNIVWWKRLHPSEGASIHYTVQKRYFPDFVAYDTNGVHWIIEGKDARGRDNAEVQSKREAAQQTVIHVLAHEAFEDQRWGYLIAYEDDIQRADTWDDLKSMASPVAPPGI